MQFQEVKLISMPSRTDKRDAFAVSASLSGFDFDIIDGVDGNQISSQALPYTLDQKPTVLGCWRAHLNVWQEMVRRQVSSALIFEDDADWDVGLRSQMIELAKGARWSLDDQKSNPHSPYGDDWDLLWIGHCGSAPAPWNDRRYVIRQDPTVPPPDSREDVGGPDMSRWETGAAGDNQTRVIFPAVGGICRAAYALTLRGAQKAVYRMSMLPFNSPGDWRLNDMCADRAFPFNCVSMYPPIIGLHRAAGNTSRNSDINESEGRIDEEGHSERLVFPTRMNMQRLLNRGTRFESVFPDLTGPERDLDEIISAQGQELKIPLRQELAHLSNEEYRHMNWAEAGIE